MKFTSHRCITAFQVNRDGETHIPEGPILDCLMVKEIIWVWVEHSEEWEKFGWTQTVRVIPSGNYNERYKWEHKKSFMNTNPNLEKRIDDLLLHLYSSR